MNDDRIDTLLEQALATGSIPQDATPAERTEVEQLLATMGIVAAARTTAAEEAQASMPAARARFQRFLGDAWRPAPVPVRQGRGFLGRLLSRGGVMTLAGSAAGIGVIALAVVLVWQLAFSSPTSAYAQVVEPGDYVQVEGVVERTADGVLHLQSDLGELEVEVSDGTTLVDASEERELSSLRPGDRLLVAGIAGPGRKIAAQTLALGEGDPTDPPPRVISFRELKRLRPDLAGEVVTYTISSDGSRGSVLIDAGDGERYLVRVDGRSAEQLLSRASTALGQRVSVVDESGVTSGTFTLEAPDEPSAPPTDRPGFLRVQGIVLDVQARPAVDSERILEGVVTVQTDRGPVRVVVRQTTRVLAGASGLTPGAGLRGEATGHAVAVSGGLDRSAGEVLADVIVMGPKAERPGSQ